MKCGLQYGLEGYWPWPIDGQNGRFDDNCDKNQNMKNSLFI